MSALDEHSLEADKKKTKKKNKKIDQILKRKAPANNHSTKRAKHSKEPEHEETKLEHDEEVRKRFRDHIAKTLSKEPDAGSKAVEVASAVEQALLAAYPDSHHYRERARELLFNIDDEGNPALRHRLLEGALTPQEFVKASASELASETVQAARRAATEEMTSAATLTEAHFLPSQEYRCFECQSTSTEYRVLTQRRDMTRGEVWGSKEADEGRAEIRCAKCGHTWTEAAL